MGESPFGQLREPTTENILLRFHRWDCVPSVTRLSPGARRGLRVGSVTCLLAGLVMVVVGFTTFATPIFDRPTGFGEVPEGPPFWSMGLFAGGGLLLVVGVALSGMAFAKPLSEVSATETQGAVEVTAAAFGRGLQTGFGKQQTLVKLRCRSCGSLDSEDAKFCSQCAKPM